MAKTWSHSDSGWTYFLRFKQNCKVQVATTKSSDCSCGVLQATAWHNHRSCSWRLLWGCKSFHALIKLHVSTDNSSRPAKNHYHVHTYIRCAAKSQSARDKKKKSFSRSTPCLDCFIGETLSFAIAKEYGIDENKLGVLRGHSLCQQRVLRQIHC